MPPTSAPAGGRRSAFTPMMVEDGRRLLISNLDLSFVSRNYGEILIERGDDGPRPGIHRRPDARTPRHTTRNCSRSRPSSSTACSPGLGVPAFDGHPHERLVPLGLARREACPRCRPGAWSDAGYYDNYGVNLAAQWMTKLREWLVENTSGVLVVQIRDHVSQKARTQINFDLEKDPEYGFFDRLTWLADRSSHPAGRLPAEHAAARRLGGPAVEHVVPQRRAGRDVRPPPPRRPAEARPTSSAPSFSSARSRPHLAGSSTVARRRRSRAAWATQSDRSPTTRTPKAS